MGGFSSTTEGCVRKPAAQPAKKRIDLKSLGQVHADDQSALPPWWIASLAQVTTMCLCPLQIVRQRWRQGETVAPHTHTHTHAPHRGASSSVFTGGATRKKHAPERRMKTPTENKRSKKAIKQKAPRWVSAGKTPIKKHENQGKPSLESPTRAKTPNSPENPPNS